MPCTKNIVKMSVIQITLQRAAHHLYRWRKPWLVLRTGNAIERMSLEFRRREKTQPSLPSEGSVLKLFLGLWGSGQQELRRIKGCCGIEGKGKNVF